MKGNRGWVDNRKYPIRDNDGNITGLFGVARDITALKQAETLIWRQASYDRLTDLPNRSLFFDRLSKSISQARRKSGYVGVLFLDLDGFKKVNGNYGHEAGDLVLKKVSNLWLPCLRDSDTLARMGGDEFAVILSDLHSPQDAALVAEKLIENLTEDLEIAKDVRCSVGVSIGISIYPMNGFEMDTLLSTADAAMYESKLNGKNSYTYSRAIANSDTQVKEWIKLEKSHLLGIPEIDNQHRKLAHIVNKLNCAASHGCEYSKTDELIAELMLFTRHHFETEHRLMVEYKYPKIGSHDKEHDNLIEEMRLMMADFHKGNDLLVLQKVKDWLSEHILYTDKPMAEFILKQRNTDL